MSILSFHAVSLKLAENCILESVDWRIHSKDRIAIVGRNGAGKSTLLSLIQGEIVPDSGVIHKKNGLRIAGLSQDVPATPEETVYHYLVKGLGEIGPLLEQYRNCSTSHNFDAMANCQQQIEALGGWELFSQIDTIATRLGVNLDAMLADLSGGMRRRVLLAATIIAKPDLLLLDEPTNHLDMQGIEWLESYLRNFSGSILVVTHDRQFLAKIANRILLIDRGHLHEFDCDYETYLDRREAMLLSEQKQAALFDKRLQIEEEWIRTGIKARRTRNEGRVRRLKAMRETYRERRKSFGKVKSASQLEVTYSGKMVIEALHLNYSINDNLLIRDFSFLLERGDKVGIIGPNGCGKTTLIRLLLGELKPLSGTIHHGTGIKIAYFDQLRSQLNMEQSVMDNVADGAQFVTVNGKQTHVASYLRDFLFAPERFNQPVFSLSGGERNRLLLAKLFAKPVNLLVMDEPTNDLDIETLELLESILIEYTGTLLFISHDREFINRVVSSIVVYEGGGVFAEFVGGYDEYCSYRKKQPVEKPQVITSDKAKLKTRTQVRLTYKESRELEALPKQIEIIEATIKEMQMELSSPEFYKQKENDTVSFKQSLEKAEMDLLKMYQRWEELEEKQG